MKKLLVVIGVISLGVMAWAAVQYAYGRGVIPMRDETYGRFIFKVHKSGDSIRGGLDFAHLKRGHNRPLNVVVLRMVRSAEFGDHAARFAGMGRLNGREVHVSCRVVDGGNSRPDLFALECRNDEGRVVFAAAGEVAHGDIVVGSRD